MAERLATVLERWTRLSMHCKHLDLKRGMEKQKKAKEQERLVREVEKNWPRIGIRLLFGGDWIGRWMIY